MDVTTTDIEHDKLASLWKMSISFLTDSTPCKKQASLDVIGNSYSTSHPYEQTQQSVNSVFARCQSQPCIRQDRVERWIASQALPSEAETEVECEPSNNSHARHDFDHWPEARRGGLGVMAHPQANFTFSGQFESDTGCIPLAGVEIVRSKAHALPKIKRHRPSPSSYSFEEKLFIMQQRILKNMEWRDIWRETATAFGVRQTGRSLVQMRRTYYHTREEWGMGYVTRHGSAGSTSDMVIVKKKMSRHTTGSSSLLRPKGC
jgi:hypothetical protein